MNPTVVHTGPRPVERASQRGVAMVVVLMFLLALLGIAVFGARYATLGESLARNQLDYEVARQAAEAALRDAERDLLLPAGPKPDLALCEREFLDGGSRSAFFSPDCSKGQCYIDPADYKKMKWKDDTAPSEAWWPEQGNGKGGKWNNDADTKPGDGGGTCNFTGGVPLGTYTGVPAIGGVALQPEYLIELMKRPGGNDVYRITARGFGYSENTQVVLQTYFKPPLQEN